MDKKLLDGLLDNMFPLEESTKYFKGLIYGDPGGGKTVLGSAIGDRDLFIQADPEGWQSLFNHEDLVVPGRIELMRYRGISQLEALASAFDEGIQNFKEFDTVIVDTGSNIANLDLDTVTKVRMKTIKEGKKNQPGRDFDFDDDMWAVYKQNAHRVRMAFLKLFSSNVNIVVTAHARKVKLMKNGIEKGTKVVPDFSPKILASINGMSSMIGYMTAIGQGVDDDGTVKYTRKLQVHPTATIIAKTRIGNLPVVIDLEDHLSLRRIVDKWQATGGALKKQEDSPMELELEENVVEDHSIRTGLEL
jgi:hypothetical protein